MDLLNLHEALRDGRRMLTCSMPWETACIGARLALVKEIRGIMWGSIRDNSVRGTRERVGLVCPARSRSIDGANTAADHDHSVRGAGVSSPSLVLRHGLWLADRLEPRSGIGITRSIICGVAAGVTPKSGEEMSKREGAKCLAARSGHRLSEALVS